MDFYYEAIIITSAGDWKGYGILLENLWSPHGKNPVVAVYTHAAYACEANF